VLDKFWQLPTQRKLSTEMRSSQSLHPVQNRPSEPLKTRSYRPARDCQSRPRERLANIQPLQLTALNNEHVTRLEAKLDLVLTQMAALSSQFDAKQTAFKNEVTEATQNRDDNIDAKLNIIALNVERHQEQLDFHETELNQLTVSIDTLKQIDFSKICDDINTAIANNNQFTTDIDNLFRLFKEAQVAKAR